MDHEQMAKVLRSLVPDSKTGLHFFDVRELAVLFFVASRSVVITKEISDNLATGKGTACAWRERAENRGLVESWHNGRETYTKVAPKGKRLLKALGTKVNVSSIAEEEVEDAE